MVNPNIECMWTPNEKEVLEGFWYVFALWRSSKGFVLGLRSHKFWSFGFKFFFFKGPFSSLQRKPGLWFKAWGLGRSNDANKSGLILLIAPEW